MKQAAAKSDAKLNPSMPSGESALAPPIAQVRTISIPADCAGQRLDQALAATLPEYSRAQIQQWIRAGHVRLAGALPRQRDTVHGGETVVIEVPEAPAPVWQAQAIALDVVYEDEAILVINKPPGLVVHPAAGNYDGTLLNALLHHAPELGALPRAGIVHRLDKDTSGLLVIARNAIARKSLIGQLQRRTLKREYLAVVNGVVIAGGSVDAPIGRHRVERKRMSVSESGRPATSHYRVQQRFRAHTLLTVQLESGRTHQIRVHMAHLHHPVVGDPVYGGRLQLPKGATPAVAAILRSFKRQALHAAHLGLRHPLTRKSLSWSAPPPADMQELIAVLTADARHGAD